MASIKQMDYGTPERVSDTQVTLHIDGPLSLFSATNKYVLWAQAITTLSK